MKEGTPHQRIDELGERLIAVIEHEADPAVVLSALAFLVAVVCDATAEGRSDDYRTMADGFVKAFRDMRHPGEMVH